MLNEQHIALISKNIAKSLLEGTTLNDLSQSELMLKISRSIKITQQQIAPQIRMQEQQRHNQAIRHAKRKAPWSFPM